MARVRIINERTHAGRSGYENHDTGQLHDIVDYGEALSAVHRCEDDDPGINGGYLYIDHQTVTGGRVNQPRVGPYPNSGQDLRWIEDAACIPIQIWSEAMFTHHEFPFPVDEAAASAAAARSNPSRPSVDLPVFAIELKDLPGTLKGLGELLYKPKDPHEYGEIVAQIAESNVNFHFDYAPLVGDVTKMLQFHDLVEKRIKRLHRLRDRGLRSTISLGQDTFTDSGGAFSLGFYPLDTSPWKATTTADCKVWCRWEPTDDSLITMSSSEMRDLAWRAVTGMNISFATAWELLPWSWLIDWFSSIGDYLNAHRNTVPSYLADCLVMYHSIHTFETEDVQTTGYLNNISCSGIYARSETKRRKRVFPTITASMPFLDSRQASILGSISFLKSI